MNFVPPQNRQQQQQRYGYMFNNFFNGMNNNPQEQAAAMEEQRRREQEQARRERGPPPASRVALKNIPDVKIAAHDLKEETNRSCSVCLEDHELGEMAVKLPCAHIFHRDCVWEWLELHCTCPVCRFELETEDSNYEKERRVRMQGRRPRYRRRELEALSIPQIRNLARGQNVSIIGCIEKADIVKRIADSGTVEVIEEVTPEYSAEALTDMSTRQLRSLMLQLGVDAEGCLEKADLLERVMNSRLIIITHDESRAPPPPPPPPSSYTSPPPYTSPPAALREQRSYEQHFAASGPPSTTRGEALTARESNNTRESDNTSENSNTRERSSTRWPWWGGRGRTAHTRAPPAAPEGARATSGSTAPPRREEPSAGVEDTTSSLARMSVRELKEISSRLGISTAGCIEKRDIVERIKVSGRYGR